jgi:hypothetical protein
VVRIRVSEESIPSRQKTGLESPTEAPPVVGYEVEAWFAEYLEVRSNSQKRCSAGVASGILARAERYVDKHRFAVPAN